jgi:hypothetical protein
VFYIVSSRSFPTSNEEEKRTLNECCSAKQGAETNDSVIRWAVKKFPEWLYFTLMVV